MMKVVQGTFRQIPYWKLRGRFHSCGYRDQEVAEHSGIGRYTMSARMNGHQPWTSKEIVAICELLDIRQDEIGELFFPTVEKGEYDRCRAGCHRARARSCAGRFQL